MAHTYKQKKILGMLTENTGTHFLDSGGSNGRQWQRNQHKQFSFSDEITMDDGYAEIPLHIYMDTMFDLDDNTAKWNRILGKSYYWTGEAADKLRELYEDIDFDGYGAMDNNSYNYENDLSQVIQYITFEYNGEYYCILQVHGGADVRGGYTNSQVFKLNDIDYFIHGQSVTFYDNSTHNEFDSYYQIEGDDRYKLSDDKTHFVNVDTGEEVYPYSSGMGF